ncbi:MAG: AMIN domain-containing protein, partial [Lysobacteraceae bacterium]
MRVKGIRFEQVLLAAMLLAALCWSLASASEIKDLRVANGATGTRAEVQLDRTGAYRVIELHNPDRLVVDFPDSRFARNLKMPGGGGAVKSVRTGQPEPGTVRVVFDLAGNVKAMPARIETSVSGPRLVLEWPGDGASVAAASKPASPVQAALPPQHDPIAAIANASVGTAGETAPARAVDKAATITPLPG